MEPKNQACTFKNQVQGYLSLLCCLECPFQGHAPYSPHLLAQGPLLQCQAVPTHRHQPQKPQGSLSKYSNRDSSPGPTLTVSCRMARACSFSSSNCWASGPTSVQGPSVWVKGLLKGKCSLKYGRGVQGVGVGWEVGPTLCKHNGWSSQALSVSQGSSHGQVPGGSAGLYSATPYLSPYRERPTGLKHSCLGWPWAGQTSPGKAMFPHLPAGSQKPTQLLGTSTVGTLLLKVP